MATRHPSCVTCKYQSGIGLPRPTIEPPPLISTPPPRTNTFRVCSEQSLGSLGADVVHSVDGCFLSDDQLVRMKAPFHAIVFNFPHTGDSGPRCHSVSNVCVCVVGAGAGDMGIWMNAAV